MKSVLVFGLLGVFDRWGVVDGFALGQTEFRNFDLHLIGKVSGGLSTCFY